MPGFDGPAIRFGRHSAAALAVVSGGAFTRITAIALYTDSKKRFASVPGASSSRHDPVDLGGHGAVSMTSMAGPLARGESFWKPDVIWSIIDAQSGLPVCRESGLKAARATPIGLD